MKRVFKLGMLVLSLVLVTGCGGSKGKTLNCTRELNETGMNESSAMKVKFKGDKVNKIDSTLKITLSDEFVSSLGSLKSSMESIYDGIKTKDGVKIKSTSDKNSFTINLELDVSKFNENELAGIDLVDVNSSYDEIKSVYEKEGYTCK